MYLLILRTLRICLVLMEEFTFHNVSINSLGDKEITVQTMLFTFHNVSINSAKGLLSLMLSLHLHSIMYLLIPVLQLPLYHL